MSEAVNAAENSCIMVTGGAGFIGRRVVRNLSGFFSKVISVDDYSFGKVRHEGSSNVTAVECDIRNRAQVFELVSKFQPACVVHLAALHHIPTCESKPDEAIAINIAGTENILRAMRHGNMVLASSGAVYDWQDTPLTENSAVLPHDLYSLCKFANEHQLRIWSEQTGGRYVVARIFNTIGHDDTNSHLIPDILKQIGDGNDTVSLGNLTPKRDYIHADDTAAAIVALAQNVAKLPIGSIYNVSSGIEHSVVDLVNAIANALDRKLNVAQDPARIRKVDRLHQLGVNEKLRGAVTWSPKNDFLRAIKRIVDRH